jgi:hypothetical protein
MTTDINSGSRSLGWLAIGWISFMLLANAWVVYILGDEIRDLVTHEDPQWRNGLFWALPLLICFVVVNFIGLSLLLVRRKAGLYLFLLATVATFIVNLYLGVSPASMLWSLIGVVVLVLVLSRRWDALR